MIKIKKMLIHLYSAMTHSITRHLPEGDNTEAITKQEGHQHPYVGTWLQSTKREKQCRQQHNDQQQQQRTQQPHQMVQPQP